MYGYGGGNTTFSVGELLRLFCSTLKEQIKHRMYFYKMATLVREGMIIVHNSGLTGDPTSAKVHPLTLSAYSVALLGGNRSSHVGLLRWT